MMDDPPADLGSPLENPPTDFDGPWKEALETYFEDALKLLVPKVAADIDWAAGYAWLDKELQQIAPDNERAAQTVDKLVRVKRLTGEDVWVLLHIEVQNQHDTDFAERMLRYHNRISERYRQRPASIAILGDTSATWRPNAVQYDVWDDTRMDFRYKVVKLLDFDMATLAANPNPFAAIILAHRATQATRKAPEARKATKIAFMRRLYEIGYNADQIRRLYRFIDWLLQLPPVLENEVWAAVETIQEEYHMPYVTYAARREMARSRDEGRIEGKIEGLHTAIDALLDVRFGGAAQIVRTETETIADVSVLEAVVKRLATAQTLDEVRAIYTAV